MLEACDPLHISSPLGTVVHSPTPSTSAENANDEEAGELENVEENLPNEPIQWQNAPTTNNNSYDGQSLFVKSHVKCPVLESSKNVADRQQISPSIPILLTNHHSDNVVHPIDSQHVPRQAHNVSVAVQREIENLENVIKTHVRFWCQKVEFSYL